MDIFVSLCFYIKILGGRVDIEQYNANIHLLNLNNN